MSTSGVPFIEVRQHKLAFLLAQVPAGRLAAIAYSAVRGRENEPGSIQRILNQDRISRIKAYTLADGDYPSCLVLNWSNPNNPLNKQDGKLFFDDVARSAQLIDGQHRLAGIREAIVERPDLEMLALPVAIYQFLSTRQCANLFLSINTEQKPVPKSLAYDLYGEVAAESIADPAAFRARDIATFLNEEPSSAYCDEIKFPGSPQRRGGIALSTAVTAIKPLVEGRGVLEQNGITELELQRAVLGNYFSTLRDCYGPKWKDKDNAFLYASGFIGAIEFFKSHLVNYCVRLRSFKVDTMRPVIVLRPENLVLQSEVKGLGGKEASGRIFDRLVAAFNPGMEQPGEIEI